MLSVLFAQQNCLLLNKLEYTYLVLHVSAIHCQSDYGRPVGKSTSLHGRKFNPTPKLLGPAKAYFVGHIGPNFQISLIYAFIGCP